MNFKEVLKHILNPTLLEKHLKEFSNEELEFLVQYLNGLALMYDTELDIRKM